VGKLGTTEEEEEEEDEEEEDGGEEEEGEDYEYELPDEDGLAQERLEELLTEQVQRRFFGGATA
jgi:hypothetical protein